MDRISVPKMATIRLHGHHRFHVWRGPQIFGTFPTWAYYLSSFKHLLEFKTVQVHGSTSFHWTQIGYDESND